jgi:hypothetical protein
MKYLMLFLLIIVCASASFFDNYKYIIITKTATSNGTLNISDAVNPILYSNNTIAFNETWADGAYYPLGSNPSGYLTSSNATNPAGADTQIQFNNNGSFGATPNLTWDKTNNYLGLGKTPSFPIDVLGNGQPIARFTGTGNVGFLAWVYTTNWVSLIPNTNNKFTITDSNWNEQLSITTGGVKAATKLGVATDNPSYPIDAQSSISGISIHSLANVSAAGYITRTTIYNKSAGSALDYIKDASQMAYIDAKAATQINHSAFYGGAIQYTTIDYGKPVNATTENATLCLPNKPPCNIITYPFNKTEEGISLDAQIAMLQQALYELKTEVCAKDGSYTFCKATPLK